MLDVNIELLRNFLFIYLIESYGNKSQVSCGAFNGSNVYIYLYN